MAHHPVKKRAAAPRSLVGRVYSVDNQRKVICKSFSRLMKTSRLTFQRLQHPRADTPPPTDTAQLHAHACQEFEKAFTHVNDAFRALKVSSPCTHPTTSMLSLNSAFSQDSTDTLRHVVQLYSGILLTHEEQ